MVFASFTLSAKKVCWCCVNEDFFCKRVVVFCDVLFQIVVLCLPGIKRICLAFVGCMVLYWCSHASFALVCLVLIVQVFFFSFFSSSPELLCVYVCSWCVRSVRSLPAHLREVPPLASYCSLAGLLPKHPMPVRIFSWAELIFFFSFFFLFFVVWFRTESSLGGRKIDKSREKEREREGGGGGSDCV